LTDLRVALLGQGFMGKAHSNAFAQVGHFYDTPFRIRRALLCGRDAESLKTMATRWEWEETSTDWRTAIIKGHRSRDIARRITPRRRAIAPRAPERSYLREALCDGSPTRKRWRDFLRSRCGDGLDNYRRVPAIAYAHS
jgi:hypothetical protein